MKKITLILLVVISTLISCNKDDDTNNESSDKIIGTWGNYKVIDDGEIWGEYDGESGYPTEYTFNSDGTYDVWWDVIGWGGNWKYISNGKFKFGEISINEYLIEFINDNEFIIIDEEDKGWVEYYRRIE